MAENVATGSHVFPTKTTVLREDNQGAIAIARNPVSHSCTKHIDIKYHYICEAIQSEDIDLEYCPTEMMVADILTKPLPRERFEKTLIWSIVQLR